MRRFRDLALWLSGFATATGLMVTDEIINLAQLCAQCKYPIR